MKALLLLNFVTPVVMLLVSVYLRWNKAPYPGPYGQGKWRTGSSGYNTPQSRKSQVHWDYAQKAAVGTFFSNGIAALVMALVCSILGVTFFPWWIGLAMGCFLGLGCMIEAFVQTERDIQTHIHS